MREFFTRLRTDFAIEPGAVDNPRPRLDWRQIAPGRTHVDLIDSDDGTTVWASTAARDQRWIEYAGPELSPLKRYEWRLRAEEGARAAASFMTGVQGDWPAPWIGISTAEERQRQTPDPTDTRNASTWLLGPTHSFRRSFRASSSALFLYITARGLYEVALNGARVGDAELTPGWTDYDARVLYQRYRLDARAGDHNEIRVVLADGWYSGFVGYNPKRRGGLWGVRPTFSAFIGEEDSSGVVHPLLSTDESWEYAAGPARYADLLLGTSWDARSAALTDAFGAWRPAQVAPAPDDRLLVIGDTGPSVRVTDELAGTVVSSTPSRCVIDFGQNFAGRVRARVVGPAGALLTFRHAEAVDGQGDLYTENLRFAEQTDHYVLRGGDEETFAPAFTYHGFRFVEIVGDLEAVRIESVAGQVMHSDTPVAGGFRTTHAGVQQIWQNAWWSQRSNFVSVPTDCPQRDERLGWLADAHVFFPTACFNADVSAFGRSWMEEVRGAQSDDGAYPDVAPRANHAFDGAPGWDDGAALLTRTLLVHYDDVPLARRMLGGLRRWVDFVLTRNPDVLRTRSLGNNYGDWLAADFSTPPEVVAAAYFIHSLDAIAEIAEAAEELDTAREMQSLAQSARRAFAAEFVDDSGTVAGDSQAAYVLALAFSLAPEHSSTHIERLIERVRDADDHLTTGFLATRHLLPVLADNGAVEVAYDVLLQPTTPSWLATVAAGATTMWEQWDATDGKGRFAPPVLNSLNHYAFGSVAEFLYSHVAGIRQEDGSRGFQRVVLAPQPDPRLGEAAAWHDSPRGRICSGWFYRDGDLYVHGEVPADVTARLEAPRGWRIRSSGESHKPLRPGGFALRMERASERQDMTC